MTLGILSITTHFRSLCYVQTPLHKRRFTDVPRSSNFVHPSFLTLQATTRTRLNRCQLILLKLDHMIIEFSLYTSYVLLYDRFIQMHTYTYIYMKLYIYNRSSILFACNFSTVLLLKSLSSDLLVDSVEHPSRNPLTKRGQSYGMG